jgi:hypothetical protein
MLLDRHNCSKHWEVQLIHNEADNTANYKGSGKGGGGDGGAVLCSGRVKSLEIFRLVFEGLNIYIILAQHS